MIHIIFFIFSHIIFLTFISFEFIMENIAKGINCGRYSSNLIAKNNFRFTEVVGNLGIQEDSKPFKKLNFENTEELKLEYLNLKGNNPSSEISDFSFSFDESKELESDLARIPRINSSAFKPRNTDSKVSPYFRKNDKFSTIHTLSSDSSKMPDDIFEIEKAGSTKISTQNEDKENIPSRSKEYLDFLPAKKFCKHCNCEVNTTIKKVH